MADKQSQDKRYEYLLKNLKNIIILKIFIGIILPPKNLLVERSLAHGAGGHTRVRIPLSPPKSNLY